MQQAASPGERAMAIFRSGYNCAEAVLMATAECLRIESPVIPRAATPFGAGIGRTQGICGALTGGVLAIGLALGRDELPGNRPLCDRVASGYVGWFHEQFGGEACRAISGVDFADEAQNAAFRAPGGRHDAVCSPMVGRCADYLCDAIRAARAE